MDNNYQVLGIPCDSNDEQIRAAYRKLALKWHPDRHLDNTDEATLQFVEINKAYRAILRERRRARRKAQAKSDVSPVVSKPESPSPTEPLGETAEEDSVFGSWLLPNVPLDSTIKEFINSPQLFSWATSKAASFFESGIAVSTLDASRRMNKSPRMRLRKQSKPVHQKVDLYCNSSQFSEKSSLRPHKPEDTFNNPISDAEDCILLPEDDHLFLGSGVAKEWIHVINMSLEELLNGRQYRFRAICRKLSGKKKEVILDVNVPSGSCDGTQIVFKNSGHERKDGSRQDIVFLVSELKHARFRRSHDDLIMDVTLLSDDSCRGDEREVHIEGIDGKEHVFCVNFAEHKFTGVKSIPHSGMQRRNGSGRGKLVIRWEIVFQSLGTWNNIKRLLG